MGYLREVGVVGKRRGGTVRGEKKKEGERERKRDKQKSREGE